MSLLTLMVQNTLLTPASGCLSPLPGHCLLSGQTGVLRPPLANYLSLVYSSDGSHWEIINFRHWQLRVSRHCLLPSVPPRHCNLRLVQFAFTHYSMTINNNGFLRMSSFCNSIWVGQAYVYNKESLRSVKYRAICCLISGWSTWGLQVCRSAGVPS